MFFEVQTKRQSFRTKYTIISNKFRLEGYSEILFLLTLRLFGKQETFEAVDAEKAEVNI